MAFSLGIFVLTFSLLVILIQGFRALRSIRESYGEKSHQYRDLLMIVKLYIIWGSYALFLSLLESGLRNSVYIWVLSYWSVTVRAIYMADPDCWNFRPKHSHGEVGMDRF